MVCDFSYKNDGMLRQWECLDYGTSGRLMQRAIADVSDVTVGKAFAADAFELTYPPGTVVNDYRAPLVR
jgi:outer membrane lipoprotein-sorting protein